MSRSKAADVLFWVLAAVAAAMLALFALVLAGALPVAQSESAPAPRESLAQERTNEAPPAPDPERAAARTASERESARAAAPQAAAPADALTTVVVTASRGDCWLSARIGSATGRLLAEQLLRHGESVRVRGPKVWLSLGAAGNVEVLVDGERHEVAPGTVALVLGSRSKA